MDLRADERSLQFPFRSAAPYLFPPHAKERNVGRVQIVIRPLDNAGAHSNGSDTELDSDSIESALLVSDINLVHGTAELFADGKRIARLIKRGTGHAPFWELG
jgi:hypothetical protein